MTIKQASSDKAFYLSVRRPHTISMGIVITTLTEETCDSKRIVEFLQKIKEKYPDRKIVVLLGIVICRVKCILI